uniref:Cytochrome c oxidase subunit 3 n=1 Tax=Saccharomycodes ludwigii TaxID=36035 RepID=A0A2U7M2Y9_9ASCO|nr:cytochrome c oxidase subunit 3 [Saccharomycodes ludwigii]APD14970.1 cytochrome c oxidase subunit 3 [Saccharomycodes ludwigii]APD14982.1 cytochrome c oxidase subunit 3 [Saccharomycodes ludwigii]APD14993.1 cytochrome c oxidase subunit 3 [Saccharomycodes ludwigii]APD15004.1 cytochrome c oxidase subunit 3 [Saccharomycodes ludwigii]APD15016.1 cytochrome c oxidase subunit 3 [Saccharomycodes ludwigii]
MTFTNKQRGMFQVFPFHLVEPSPWPIVVSFTLLSLVLSLAMTMHGYMNNMTMVTVSLITLLSSMTLWFRDIIAEGTYLGDHTLAVRKGLNLGFLLFVVSEIMIFAALFWAYFHSAMSPAIELGSVWPPVGIEAVQPTELPLLNTVILLSSGVTMTYSHHALINNDRKNALSGLFITTWLIIIFVTIQFIEYTNATFTISDGVYGSVFYAGTGLHFLHMVMLIIMLSINYWRMRNYQLTSGHHVGYETTIIYGHILDIIWLFLYIVFYWWGV